MRRIVVFAACLLLLLGCRQNAVPSSSAIEVSNETLVTFSTDGDRVLFVCELDVSNPTEEKLSFEIHGDFSKDRENGLILENELTASNPETASAVFELNAASESHLIVEFVGTFAGNPNKADRNPPEIIILVKS